MMYKIDPNKELYARVLDLFRKYGIKSVTMDDIARELAISKKTLYERISDKNELVEAVVAYEFDHLKKGFESVFHDEEQNAIQQLLEANRFMRKLLQYYSYSFDFDLRKYYPSIYEDLTKKKQEEMFQSIRENMLKGKAEGIYREELNVELIARLYVSRMSQVHENRVIPLEDFTSAESFKEYFVYHIRGIANPKGIEILENELHNVE